MTIWLIFACMTAAAVAALLIPFLRKLSGPEDSDAEYDRNVYRDQLQELDRDRDRGLIGTAEADAARNEISRRLLQVAKPKLQASGNRISLLVVLLVPLIALPLYAKIGSPTVPDVPLQKRMEGAIANQDFTALVAKVEQHVAQTPDDSAGWKVLAPAYRRENRWIDAADAYANILRLEPATAQTIADYAEMLVYANEGMVTADAQQAFAEALRLDPADARSKYYYDLAVSQEGGAPALTDEQIASGKAMSAGDQSTQEGRAPTLTDEQVASVKAMSAEDQSTMIAGMIDGLEQRLGTDSRDIEGWKRLIRARRVSNDSDKAKKSLALALNIFKDEPVSLEALRGLAKELGIE